MYRPTTGQNIHETSFFSHSTFYGDTTGIYTTIGGVEQARLLVDPEASKGLIGSDTLKTIMDKVLKPKGLMHKVDWFRSTASFTSISTNSEHNLRLGRFPVGLNGMTHCFFKADVIGGSESRCPGLIPLRSLTPLHAALLCGWLSNGDGIIGIWNQGTWKPQRLHLTDTGHYLLRIDNFHSNAMNPEPMTRTISKISAKVSKNPDHRNTSVELHGNHHQSYWTPYSTEADWHPTTQFGESPQKQRVFQ